MSHAKHPDSRLLGDPGTAAFQVGKYPFYLLNRAVSRYNSVIEVRLRSIGIDIPNWRVLMILGEHQPRSIGQLADAAVINLSTTMRIAQRMQAAGLVTCTTSVEDARVTEVRLTEAGEERLVEARHVTAPVYAAAIKGLSARDFDRMVALLDELYTNLSALEES